MYLITVQQNDEINFSSLKENMDDLIEKNSTNGFKPNNKTYRRVYNRNLKEVKAIDKFGDSYFSDNKADDTMSLSITLPKSLVKEVDAYCNKHKITRSRLIRKILEFSLDLRKV